LWWGYTFVNGVLEGNGKIWTRESWDSISSAMCIKKKS
jgi:hypothetical protein